MLHRVKHTSLLSLVCSSSCSTLGSGFSTRLSGLAAVVAGTSCTAHSTQSLLLSPSFHANTRGRDPGLNATNCVVERLPSVYYYYYYYQHRRHSNQTGFSIDLSQLKVGRGVCSSRITNNCGNYNNNNNNSNNRNCVGVTSRRLFSCLLKDEGSGCRSRRSGYKFNERVYSQRASTPLHGNNNNAFIRRCVGKMENKATEDRQADWNPNPFREREGAEFLQRAFELIVEKALKEGCDRDQPVVEFKHPQELRSLLNLELSAEPASHDVLLEEMRKIIKYSVKSGHPQFYNQLYAGLDPYSQAGAWLTEATNANIHTFEVSPVNVVMERYMVETLCELLGYDDGDGTFLPGGSTSNNFALHLAKHRAFPDAKKTGLFGLPCMRMYTSEDAHYSLKKGSSYLGFGVDNVVMVNTDFQGRMDVGHLEEKILEDKAQGFHPLFVMATSGTTVLGAFDPLVEMSRVCQKHGLWLHCDGCLGGPAILSPKYKHLLEGSELCDSFAWNFHKLNGLPLQCAGLFVKHKGLMEQANQFKAEYLFQPDKFYDTSYDIGDKTILCGRKPDSVKLWLQWKALGNDGMAARIDRAFGNARYLAEKMDSTEGFRLVRKEIFCINVCFWYIPPRLRNQPETDQWWQEIKKVAPKIKERMVKSGTMLIGFQPLSTKGLVNFFRFVVNNPMNGHQDMDFVMQEIDRCGHDL